MTPRSRYLLFILLTVIAGAGFTQTCIPGLFNPDGTPHAVPAPNPVTGQTMNVLDFGADPADNENDDRPAIEAALEAAQKGDEIFFTNGVYNLNSASHLDSHSHLVLKSGVNLRGQSVAATRLKSSFAREKNLNENTRLFKIFGLEDILISDLTLTSTFTGNYSTDTNNNNPQRDGPQYAIALDDHSRKIIIDRVIVEKYQRHGVRLSNSQDVVVKNSLFRNATDVGGGGAGYGVSIQGNGQFDNYSRFNVVENCQFLGPYLRHGVLLQYATHNNAVCFNDFEDNRLDAIDLHGEDEYCNEIYQNEVRDVKTGAGVGVGNTGSTHDASGPFNFIHNNLMINCREGVKVYLGSPDTRIEKNVIKQSQVGSGKGIYLLNAPRTTVTANQIFDNSGINFSGILLNYDGGTAGKGTGPPTDIHLIENEIYHNDYGIRIFSGENIILENNQVYDNFKADFYSAVPVFYHKRLLTAVQGQGQIELEPPGGSYAVGQTVKLNAKRAANWRFRHWEGDLTGSNNPDSLVIDDNKAVTAVFTEDPGLNEVTLTYQIQGMGQVHLNPPGGIYEIGTSIILTAEPAAGWEFRHWTGALQGTRAQDTLLLDSDKTVVAVFEALPRYRLFAWIMGGGKVITEPEGEFFPAGTIVTLTAVPDSGWRFDHWEGALTGSDNPTTLLMDEDKAYIAKFEKVVSVDYAKTQTNEYCIEQNYPNPFNPTTNIVFSLRNAGWAKLEIFNGQGQTITTLLNAYLEAGFHRVTFHAESLSSGIYFYRLETEDFQMMRKMILLR